MSGYTDHGLSPDGVLSVIRDARAHVERDHWLVGGPKRTIGTLLAEIDRLRADFANACDVGRRQEARAEAAEAALVALREAAQAVRWGLDPHEPQPEHAPDSSGGGWRDLCAALDAALAATPADLATRDARIRAEALRDAASEIDAAHALATRDRAVSEAATLRSLTARLLAMADEAARGAR